MVKIAKLALEDGTVIKGEGFGYETTKLGELVFSTGMGGYTESLTDPSFKGEILMSTYPLEGNHGVSEKWYQSDNIQVEGYIPENYVENDIEKLNLYKREFTNTSKHDIMHSAKLKTMCSANKDFAMRIYQKGLCGKAFGL